MAGMTHHIQGHLAAVDAAPALRWSAIDGVRRLRSHGFSVATPKTATNVVKPFCGYARRPLEGSS